MQTIRGLRNYSHELSSGHLADMIGFILLLNTSSRVCFTIIFKAGLKVIIKNVDIKVSTYPPINPTLYSTPSGDMHHYSIKKYSSHLRVPSASLLPQLIFRATCLHIALNYLY